MQTYTNIISQLTEGQKVRLLTDFNSLIESDMAELGLPSVQSAVLARRTGGRFCAPEVLARSWDSELIADASASVCRHLARMGVRHVTLPGARATLGDIDTSLSEDPYLSSLLSLAYACGADRVGIISSLSGYTARPVKSTALKGKHKIVWSDRTPSDRVINEQLVLPFERALSATKCASVVVDPADVLHDSLKKVTYINEDGEECEKEILVLRTNVGDSDTVSTLNRGEICLSGSAPTLQGALHNYRRLKSAIDHGQATSFDLESAVASGEAISEETVDNALCKLLEFAFATSESVVDVQTLDPKGLRERGLKESSVLLTNNGVLPLSAPIKKVCIVGDAADRFGNKAAELGELLTKIGYNYVGYSRGYVLEDERSEDLLSEAYRLVAEQADAVLLFMSTDTRSNSMHIPANQLALLDELTKTSKRVIAVLSSGGAPDMSFLSNMERAPDAILLAPLNVKGGAESALKIILGMHSPEGRLTRSFIDCTSPACDRRGLKVGPFTGYRYFDTVGEGMNFPFGHGLTYSTFAYSDAYVENGEAVFRVTNTGRRAALEVAQVYLGKGDSTCLRPKKELAGFARVFLEPEESRLVRVPLSVPKIYDGTLNKAVTEAGVYTVYIGASVSDIRQTCLVSLEGEALTPDGLCASDYLTTATNIFNEHFTLEAEYKPMKSTLRNLIFGISAICLAAAIKVYDIVTISNSLFLNIVAGVLLFGAIVFFALEIVDRKKQFAKRQKELAEANAEFFKEADEIDVPSASKLFEDAYAEEESAREEAERAPDNDGSEWDYFSDVDKTLTFAQAAKELSALARDKGIVLDVHTALDIFASFATARLVLVRGMSEQNFAALCALLGEYFGAAAGMNKVDESYVTESDVLFATVEGSDEKTARDAYVSIGAARANGKNIHIVPFDGVTLDGMSSYFAPYARYARSPFVTNALNVKDAEGSNTTVRIPQNVWLLLNIKEGEALDTLPAYISEIATINNWRIEADGEEGEQTADFKHFGYGQMLYLCDRIRNDFVLNEDTWKKLDALEVFAQRHGSFKATNKLWLGIESYLGVLMNAETPEPDAVDKTISVKLLPSLIGALAGKISRDDRGLSETLDVLFGEEHTAECRKVVRDCGANIN